MCGAAGSPIRARREAPAAVCAAEGGTKSNSSRVFLLRRTDPVFFIYFIYLFFLKADQGTECPGCQEEAHLAVDGE